MNALKILKFVNKFIVCHQVPFIIHRLKNDCRVYEARFNIKAKL